MAIVLHMPVGYTELYARKLDEMSPLKVCEAAEAIEMRPGTVLIAPAGRHLTLRRNDGAVDHAPRCPAARHAAPAVGRRAVSIGGRRLRGRVLGIVMTGMGEDGREGAAWIKAKGGTILTEVRRDAAWSTACRAPIVEAGLSDRVRRPGTDGRSHSGARVTQKLLLVDDSALARRSMRAHPRAGRLRGGRGRRRHGRARALFAREAGPGDSRSGDEGDVRARRADQAARARSRRRASSSCRRTFSNRRSEIVEAAGASGFINKPVDREQRARALVRGVLGRADAMKLTAVQEDALIELLNIGFGRAAASLSQLTGHRVLLEVPQVTIHPVEEVSESLERVIRPTSRACTRSSAARSPATRC